MSAILEIGLALAGDYRQKKDQKAAANLAQQEAIQAIREQEAAIDLKRQEASFDLQKQSALKTQDEAIAIRKEERDDLRKTRELKVHTIMWGKGNQIKSVTYGPAQLQLPPGEGWTQLATSIGVEPGSTGQPFLKNTDYLEDIPKPLYNVRGTPMTADEATADASRRLSPEAMLLFDPGISIGERTRKNGNRIFNDEEYKRVAGSLQKTVLSVVNENNEITTGTLAQVRPIAEATGNDIMEVTTEVDSRGTPLGPSSSKKFSGVPDPNRQEINIVYDAWIPTKSGGTTQLSNVTEDELDTALAKRGLVRSDVAFEAQKITTDKYTNEVLGIDVFERYTPKDVTFEKSAVDVLFPDGSFLSDISPTDLAAHLQVRSLTENQVTVIPKTLKFLNGEPSSTISGDIRYPSGIVHFGFVTENGERKRVQAESPAALKLMFQNNSTYEYGGSEEGAGAERKTTPADARTDVLYFGPNLPTEGALGSTLTQDEKRVALSSREVKVDPVTREIIDTGDRKNTEFALLRSKMNVPFLLEGTEVLLGAPSDLDMPVQLARMNLKLQGSNLQQLIDNNQSEDYINAFGPLIYGHVSSMEAQSKMDTGVSILAGKSVTKYTLDMYPNFAKIPGMKKYLFNIERQKIGSSIESITEQLGENANHGEIPIVAETSTNPATMDDDNNAPTPTHNGAQSLVIGCNVPGQYGEFCKKRLIPIMNAVNSGVAEENKSKLNLLNLMNKEFGPDGRPVTQINENGDAIVQIKPVQPLVDKLMSFDSEVLGTDETSGAKITYLTRFIDAANGKTTNATDFEYMSSYVTAAGSLNDAVIGVVPFITSIQSTQLDGTTFVPPALRDAAKRNGIGEFSTNIADRNFVALSAKQLSANKVIDYSGMLINSLYDAETGTYRASTGVGELELTVRGLFYLRDEAVSRVSGFLKNGNASGIANTIKDNINEYKARILEEAREVNPAAFNEENAQAQAEINKIIDDIAEEAATADTETKRLYAVRQLYIVSLAYELSATMQGGTGGRTISDQDVAIILSALRQKFTASPESQVAVLEEVRRIARDINTDMGFQMSQDEQTAAAYYFVKGLSAVNNDPRGFHKTITASSVAARIRGSRPGGNVDDTGILNTINLQNGTNYQSLDEVPSDIIDAARGSIG
jgi:hypothetical protein